jgi:hypothetical protein
VGTADGTGVGMAVGRVLGPGAERLGATGDGALAGWDALAAGAGELQALGLRTGAAATLQWPAGAQPVRLGTTFADASPGELVVLVDSAGHLAVACRGCSAARRTGLRPGRVLELTIN